MDTNDIEKIVDACVSDPRKLGWLEGFCRGFSAAEAAAANQRDENGGKYAKAD